MRSTLQTGPAVWLVGELEHADFAEATALLRATAHCGPGMPELIVLAQSRPGVIGVREIERLRQSAPLAGMVSLVGSWCEGETRTGKPTPGVQRLYWYEFPSWWQRQLALWRAGCCPEWAQGKDFGSQNADCRLLNERIGIGTLRWDTAMAVADGLKATGAETIWLRPGNRDGVWPAMTAGIWEGGQLSDTEAEQLAMFCQRLTENDAPVVALLDFPRRDRCEVARRAGAAAVLGKPWLNVDLMTTLRAVIGQIKLTRMAQSPHAA